MKNYSHIAFILVFFLIGCASSPINTLNKRMAAVEISFQEIEKLALLHQSEGRLSVEKQLKIDKAFTDYTKARNAARKAIKLSDIELAENKILAMSQILTAIRPFVGGE